MRRGIWHTSNYALFHKAYWWWAGHQMDSKRKIKDETTHLKHWLNMQNIILLANTNDFLVDIIKQLRTMPLPRASWSFYCHRLSNSIFFFMKTLQSKTNKILLIPNVTRRNTFGRRSQFSFLIPSLTLLISSTCTYDTAPRTLLVMIVTLNETSRATIWARNPGQVIHHG